MQGNPHSILQPISESGTTAVPDMGMGLVLQLLFVALSILTVAFFTSSEASLLSVGKIRIRHLAEQGSKAAQTIQRIMENHDSFFATILFTENAFIILASSIGTALAISLLGSSPAAVLAASLVMTIIVVSLGEITPKTLAVRSAERWSLIVARPIELVMKVETVVIYLFTLLPRGVVKLMGGPKVFKSPFVTEAEIRMLIDISEAEGMVEEHEADMLENVFKFGDQQVMEIMTPRTEIVWLEKGATLGQFLSIYSQHRHTRLPVYDEGMDNVIGVLSTKDIITAMAQDSINSESIITDLSRPAFFVPETKYLDDLLPEMGNLRSPVALAVDEFGTISGLVTMKQVVGKIVGRYTEEETPTEEFRDIDDKTTQINGNMRIEEANEKLGLGLPDGEYETVAGFVLASLGHIPREGAQLRLDGLHLIVQQMKGVRIDKVLAIRF